MMDRHTVLMETTKKPVTITFLIPEDWDTNSFVLELAGAYDDADHEAAEQVEYFRGPVN